MQNLGLVLCEVGQPVVGDLIVGQVLGLELEQLDIGHLVLHCVVCALVRLCWLTAGVLPLHIHIYVSIVSIDVGIVVSVGAFDECV